MITSALLDAFSAFQGQRLAGVRWKNWQLVLPPANDAKAAAQLFDLSQDLGEQHDVAKDHAEVVKQITALADRAEGRSSVGERTHIERLTPDNLA